MSFPNYASGQAAAGTLLQLAVAGASPEVFATVGRITDINGPQIATAMVKTTSHSTATATGQVFDTFIPTTTDPGKIAFKLFPKTDTAADRTLAGYALNRTPLDFKIVEPDSLLSIIEGSCFFTKYSLTHPIAGAVEAACEMQATGPIYVFES